MDSLTDLELRYGPKYEELIDFLFFLAQLKEIYVHQKNKHMDMFCHPLIKY